MKKVKGSKIKSISTEYENLSVTMTNGDVFRMKPEDILGILQREDYTPKKARKHTYLKSSVEELIRPLTKRELTKLSKAIDTLEEQMVYEFGLDEETGYVIIDMYDYNNDEIFVTVKTGEFEDEEVVENLSMCREEMDNIY